MAKIVLNGEVGYEITLKNISDEIEKIPIDEPIEIILSSIGGNVLEGIAIYQYLKKLSEEREITMVGMGGVASIATIIFLGVRKEKRHIYEGTQFIIHLPFGYVTGTADQLRKNADEIEMLQNVMIDIYLAETTIPKETLLEWLEIEKILTEKELIDFEVVSKIEKMKAVANIKINNMNLNDIKKMFGLTATQAKVILDANGTELEFPELDENATPKVGDKAVIDGEPANGEYVMPDGKTFVFKEGVLTEIKEQSGSDERKDFDEKTKEVVKELVKQVETLTKENAKLKTELLAVKGEYEGFLTAIKSKFNFNPDNMKLDNGYGGNGRKIQKLK